MKSPTEPINKYARFTSMGVQLLVNIFIFVYLGYKLDEWLKTQTPWFTAGFALFGVISSMVYFVYQMNRSFAPQNRKNAEDKKNDTPNAIPPHEPADKHNP